MKKAQVLLITVMILATIMTVVLAISFQSISDTQISKLEEENQKALAAAEAAVESSLKENISTTIGEGTLENITGFTGGATITSIADNKFTTGLVEKNDLYTFYLANYDPDTKILDTTSLNETVTICFESASTNPAIEVTVLKTGSVKKFAVDPSSRITSASTPSSLCPDSNFQYSYDIPASAIETDSQLMLVKVLYNNTRLYFSRSSNFPLQGRAATSEITSDTGVYKKVYLFQTYPQIPAEFFDTSF